MQRWVRKDRRIYEFSDCRLCGSAHGVVKPEIEHRESTCLACGSRQCLGNGTARGTCSVCLVGLLPGWSGTDCVCDYKGCDETAVALVDGKNRRRCRKHLERGKWAGYVDRRLAERERGWILVDESPNSPY